MRHTHFGEGEYDQSEKIIQALLAEGTDKNYGETSSDNENVPFTAGQSPETYLGYYRANSLANADQAVQDKATEYKLPASIDLNDWALGGNWELTGENVISRSDGAELIMRFAAKELYLVMESDDGSEKTLQVYVDDELVSEKGVAGDDVNADGAAVISRGELYRLVKFPEFRSDATLKLVVPAGVRMNAFTFGG